MKQTTLSKVYYNHSYDVLAIGVSTGGPTALKNLLSRLPSNVPIGVVVVQHMMSGYISHLVTWLKDYCSIQIKVAQDGEFLKPGVVYVAPGDIHLAVNTHRQIILTKQPYDASHKPSIDVMMNSVAQAFGKKAIGMILTGMGEDGVSGIGAIKSAGGVTIAQGEQSSEIFDMPKRAIDKDHIDHVVEMHYLPEHLIEII